MVDEIKPPVSESTTPPPSSSSPSGLTSLKPSGPPPPPKPSGPSPLTPDIKIPPNLPTVEVKPPVFSKLPVPSSSFQASQPLKPPPLSPPLVSRPPLMPSVPATGVKPPIPPPLTSQSGQPPAVFKSSIRTMQDDLAALKKGQTPSGFKIEKESEKETKPVSQDASPKITLPSPISHVELGKLERAKPLTAEAPPMRQTSLGAGQTQKPAVPILPQLGLTKPSISMPSSASGIFGRFKSDPKFKRIAIYVIVGIVGFIITAYLIPYFTSLPTASVSPTPSATLTRTPTVTPASLESLFSVSDSISISLGPDFTTRFVDSVKTDPLRYSGDTLLSSAETGIYSITSVDGSKRHGFSEFFSGVSVTVPDELKSFIDDGNIWLTLTYKSNNTVSFGFVAKLLNPQKTNEAKTALQNWEVVITQSLMELFQFDSSKAASIGFLDNTYNGTTIRYRNFPDTNSTIDYALVQAKNGESYLVVVNSKEHIYKILDKLK